MAKGSSKQRGPKPKETTKKVKKKVSILVAERVDYVDYKDVNLLQRFVSDRSKIRARRVSGNDVQQQRDITTAIKNAREMALMPYAKRVTTQRGGRGGERGERGDRGDRYGRDAEAAAANAADLEAMDAVEETEGEEDGE